MRSPNHPPSHNFAWERGRIIREYQLIYIAEGSGVFESAASGRLRVPRQSLILLFPGVWHRYKPDQGTGWTEHWIELEGPLLEALLERQVLSTTSPKHRVIDPSSVTALFQQCHKLAGSSPAGFNVQLAWVAMQILTAIIPVSRPLRGGRQRRIAASALHELGHSFGEGKGLEEIARRLHMSYSHFRREFRKETGLSPGEYQKRVRLRRARELLAATDLPLKEIAGELGYHSPYHFSSDFKARTGLSPSFWRKKSSNQ